MLKHFSSKFLIAGPCSLESESLSLEVASQLKKISKKFKPKKNWYDDKILVGDNLNFDRKKDFVIIPEIWAHFATDLKFIEQKINYAIFVQGFYHMNSTNNFLKLKKSYENAKLIITTSKYTVSYLRTMFPRIKKKIFKVNLSVDSNKFKIKIRHFFG